MAMADQPSGAGPGGGSTQASPTDPVPTPAEPSQEAKDAGVNAKPAGEADGRRPDGTEPAKHDTEPKDGSAGPKDENTKPKDAGAEPKGQSTEPAFEFDWCGVKLKEKCSWPEADEDYDRFNLRPRPDRKFPIPEDQRKISQEVYEVRNILKLLREHKTFPKAIGPDLYKEFIARALQAGTVGCVADYVQPILAAGALEQIRADIVRRVGVSLVYTYLTVLAGWAVVALLGGLVVSDLIGRIAAGLGHHAVWLPINGYKWLLLGAMTGAWFSVAARRQEVGFDNLPLYLNRFVEPVIRLLFVVVVAAVFAIFLHRHLLTINIGDIDFAQFETSVGVALFVGFVAGISERALSARLIGEASKAFPGAKSSTGK
jgi:hypothetical protein